MKVKRNFVRGAMLGVAMLVLGLGSIHVNAAKKSSADEMNVTQTGVLLKYTDTSEKKHSVVIPKTVIQIADEAFSGCEKITEIKFENPDNIKEIGKNAFSGCTALKKFTIPKNIAYLEANTFNSCSSLKEIKFNNKIKSIGENCFGSCVSLKKLELPKKLEFIEGSAFANCSKLESITLPSGLVYIGDQAFSGCAKLKIKDGVFPNDLVTLGAKAFQNCTSLDKVVLYSNLGTYAFEDARPSGLGPDCFTGCAKLKKVVFKNAKSKVDITKKEYFTEPLGGLKYLSYGLFSNCKKLKEVVIGDYFIEDIDDTIFNGCDGTITIKAPKWVLDKKIKSFVESYKQNNVTLKYEAVK